MGGLKGFLVGVAAVAAGTVGVLVAIEARRVAVAPEPEPALAEGSAPPAPAVGAPAPEAPLQATPEPPPDAPIAPRFDLVRVEPDGATLVAGSTDPGDVVEVLLDNAAAATVAADPSGAFVASFALPPGGGLLRMDLRARGASGERLSLEPVFVTAPGGDAPDAEPPVVAQARPEGMALLQAPPRPQNAPVTLDMLSYSPDGAVVMQGRASPHGLVRIYADATMIAEAQVSPSGDWSVEGAEGLAPGGYTLRVDELGPEGRVVSRIETPFQRVAETEARLADGQIVVQPGDSLWRIAQQVYGRGLRYTVIYDSNRARIRDPDLIYPGQVLELPQAAPAP